MRPKRAPRIGPRGKKTATQAAKRRKRWLIIHQLNGCFTQNGVAYGCAGASVILTPETAWSRRRMEVLYGSADQAAAPTDEVRARTPEAPAGDSTPYIKRATCDPTDKFSFRGLPDGAWFVITLAKPKTGGSGSLAMMKRVTTKGGKVTPVAF